MDARFQARPVRRVLLEQVQIQVEQALLDQQVIQDLRVLLVQVQIQVPRVLVDQWAQLALVAQLALGARQA